MRQLLPVAIIIALAGAALGYLAFALSSSEFDASTRALDQRRIDDTESLRARIAAALGEADRVARSRLDRADEVDAEWSKTDAILAYVDATDGKLRYAPRAVVPRPIPEDLRLYDLATTGGADFEFVQHEPNRALDAYAFYMPKIESSLLKDRLRFSIARTALRAGKNTLALSLLDELLESGGSSELDGLPISLLAGLALIGLEQAGLERAGRELHARGRVTEHLAVIERSLSTVVLAQFVEQVCPKHPDLPARVRARRAFEATALRVADHLERDGIALDCERLPQGDRLLERRPARQEANLDRIVSVPIALPSLALDPYRTTLVVASAQVDARPASADDRELVPIALSEAGAPLAWLEVIDPLRADRIAAFARRRVLERTLTIVLLVLVALAGIASWIVLDRQRRTAQFRVRLLANVSHELKTPITSMRILSELLSEEQMSPNDVQRFGKLLTAESQRLTQRVEDLLEYARNEDRSPLARAPVDLHATLESLIAPFQFRAAENDVRLEHDIAHDPSRTVLGDTNAIERIVLNLLDNALKYRSKVDPWIRLTVADDASGVRIGVADNGIGIDTRDQSQIFDEFYRARFEDYAIQGSGLGLAIARNLARRLGGDLTVDSTLGAGSHFTLTLPYAGDNAMTEKR